MTSKRALSRLDTSPATSDVTTCKHCGSAVTGRKAIRLAEKWSTRPVCCHCRAFSRGATSHPHGTRPSARIRDHPTPRPRVIVVRRTPPPSDVVTGLRAKLAARNLPTWEAEGLR